MGRENYNDNNNNNSNNTVSYTFANICTFTLLSGCLFVGYERHMKERLIHNPHTMWVVKTAVYRCVSLRENSSLQAGSTGTIGKSLWICKCSNRWKQHRQMCSSVQTVLSYLKYRTYWGTVCITAQAPISVFSFPYRIRQERNPPQF